MGGADAILTACRWTGRSAIARAHALAGRIREVSIGLEEYSPYLDRDLADLNFFDAGDIPLPFGNPQRSLDMIEEYVDSILEKGSSQWAWAGSTSCHGLSLKQCTRNTQTLRLSILTHIQIFALIMRRTAFSLHADPQSGRIDRTEQCIFIRNPFRHERRV